MTEPLQLVKGANLASTGTIGLNLTGFTLSVFDEDSTIAGITVTLTNAATGAFSLAMAWRELAVGSTHTFRIKWVSPGGVPSTTKPIVILVE
jgi:hypothetical protein